MQPEFWHDKWQKMEIGFHLPEVNKLLRKYWPVLGLSAPAHVLVPLCGKSLDLIWLRAQGHRVTGIELSEIALDALAAEFADSLGLPLEKEHREGRIDYRGDGVHLIATDIFRLSADALPPVAAVYDRAALVALPADLRQRYSAHLRALSRNAPQLLITLDYDQPRMDGPPFAVSDAEVLDHYATHFTCERLESRELIDQEPRFQARGLTSFRQQVFRLA